MFSERRNLRSYFSRALAISGVLLLFGRIRRNGRKEREYATTSRAAGIRGRNARDSHARASCMTMRVSWRAAVTYSDGGGRSFKRLLAASRDVACTYTHVPAYISLLSEKRILRVSVALILRPVNCELWCANLPIQHTNLQLHCNITVRL